MLIALDDSILELEDNLNLLEKISFLSNLVSYVQSANDLDIHAGFTSGAISGVMDKGIYPEGDYIEKLVESSKLKGVFTVNEIRKIYSRILSSFSSVDIDAGIEDYILDEVSQSHNAIDGIGVPANSAIYVCNIYTGIKDLNSILIHDQSGALSSDNTYGVIYLDGSEYNSMNLVTNSKVDSYYSGSIISAVDFKVFWCKDSSDAQLSFAIMRNAEELAKPLRIKFSGRKFSFSGEFIASLTDLGIFNSPFSQLVLDTCSKILIDEKIVSASEFRSGSSPNSDQLHKNGYSAYRVQVNTGNPAYRLMYWKKDDDLIFANIGLKKDLYIADV